MIFKAYFGVVPVHNILFFLNKILHQFSINSKHEIKKVS